MTEAILFIIGLICRGWSNHIESKCRNENEYT
jgi:hypothetical protein